MAEVSSMAMDWMEYLGQNDALLGSVSEANKVWLLAGICSALVGLSGLLPVIFLNPNNSKPKAGKEQQRNLGMVTGNISSLLSAKLSVLVLRMIQASLNRGSRLGAKTSVQGKP